MAKEEFMFDEKEAKNAVALITVVLEKNNISPKSAYVALFALALITVVLEKNNICPKSAYVALFALMTAIEEKFGFSYEIRAEGTGFSNEVH